MKKELYVRAAISAALISFAGAAVAANAPGQLAQASPERPGMEAPPAAGAPETQPGMEAPPAAGAPGEPGALNVQEGMDVVNAQGEKIGEVTAIEGDQVIVSVGGFLGLGARDVALQRDELQPIGTGPDAQLQTTMTQEQIEQLPAYEKPEGPTGAPSGVQPGDAPAGGGGPTGGPTGGGDGPGAGGAGPGAGGAN